ncbi:MAG: hypothetical protein ACJ0DK_06135 [Planctomycetota bacterium]
MRNRTSERAQVLFWGDDSRLRYGSPVEIGNRFRDSAIAAESGGQIAIFACHGVAVLIPLSWAVTESP